MILTLLAAVFLVLVVKYLLSNRKVYSFSSQINGPIPLPLVGNAHLLLGDTDETMHKILKLIDTHGTPMRMWIGQYFFVVLRNPIDVEKILSSTKILDKPEILDMLKPFGGEGMITGSGPIWRHARKLNQPIYHANFVAECLNIMKRHIDICIEKFEKKVDGPDLNIEPIIHSCIADIIGESILGVKLDTQLGQNKKFMDALKSVYEHVMYKMTRPWTHITAIYKMTAAYRKELGALKTLRDFFQKCMDNLETGGSEIYISDENMTFTPSAVKFMKAYINDPGCLSDKDFRDNLFTLFAASEDTVTAIAASACVCLGMYPESQEKALNEILSVIGPTPRQITYEEVNKLTYLDMCVKECLRLFPIAPFIMRKTTTDFEIDKWVVPKGCAALISIFSVHLDPNEWEKPMEFYPEHFTQEAVKKRHVYSYIPFSAGPRGCIGKLYAQVSIKIFLIHFLQKFKIEADGNYKDVFKQLKSDVSVRPRNGYMVRLKRRIH